MNRSFASQLLLLILAIFSMGHAHASDAIQATKLIKQCIAHLHESIPDLKPDHPVNLSESCNTLYSNIHDPIFKQIEPAIENETNLGKLIHSKKIIESINAAPLNNVRFKSDLDEILRSVYHAKQKAKIKKGWIDKIVDWIGKKYNEYFEHDNWFTRTFKFDKNRSESAKRGLVNSLIVVLIMIVLFIIANELRAAGILRTFRRRNKATRHDVHDQTISDSGTNPDLNDIARLPVHRQVPALLRYTLANLIKAQILPARRDLTNREYLAIVREKLPHSQHEFENLVNQSEMVVYGNKPIAAGNAGRLFEYVRNILQTKNTDKA